MRPDRFITLNVVQPWRRVASRFRSLISHNAPSDRCLPVLMYHSTANDPETGVSAYYQTTTRPEIFARQITSLKTLGFKGVDLSTGLAWLRSPRNDSSTKLVAITFDDGFRNFYTEAVPVLQRAGFTASMYLPTAFIGEQGARRSFKGRECLTWNEIRELKSAGMEFGSHTVNHPKLVDLSWDKVESELSDSKAEIEQQLGGPVANFAYPYAFPQGNKDFARRFCDLVASTGYRNCVTTEIGRVNPADDPYRLKRLPANSSDDDALLRAKLAGGYDWLARGQAAVKALKYLREYRN